MFHHGITQEEETKKNGAPSLPEEKPIVLQVAGAPFRVWSRQRTIQWAEARRRLLGLHRGVCIHGRVIYPGGVAAAATILLLPLAAHLRDGRRRRRGRRVSVWEIREEHPPLLLRPPALHQECKIRRVTVD